jgi:type IV pilus assembly protein PilV
MMKKQRGMGMIEILMAVLITAIGLIGITGMQAVSLKNNLSALNRSNAVFLTGTMMDRIRANPNATYATGYTNMPTDGLDSCAAFDADCDATAIANVNIAQWKCSLGGYQEKTTCDGIIPVMPDAQGEITLDALTGVYTITLQWTDRVSYGTVSGEVVNTGGQIVSLSTTLRR